MGAFSIAFDITIVGALALPWVLLVIHLFFSANGDPVRSLLDWANKWVIQTNQAALAGVCLFAMAYPLGSIVSRIAQDCFDDPDLRAYIFGVGLRVGVTESSIRSDVYCHNLEQIPGDFLAAKIAQFKAIDAACAYTGKWKVRQGYDRWKEIIRQDDAAKEIFQAQEGALLLRGTDANERLRQYHDQIVVLRGASFNGLVAFALCVFWWSAQFHSRLRWSVPLLCLFPGLIASYHHFIERGTGDPPYMEFALLVLAAAGWYILWTRPPKGKSELGNPEAQNGHWQIRFGHLLLAALLTVTAFLGWWATQVLYDQQLIYSYEALSQGPASQK